MILPSGNATIDPRRVDDLTNRINDTIRPVVAGFSSGELMSAVYTLTMRLTLVALESGADPEAFRRTITQLYACLPPTPPKELN